MKSNRCALLVVAMSFALLGMPAKGQSNSDAKSTTTNQSSQTEAAVSAKPATEDPNYVLGPQDILDISVWHEPDLTRTVPVRPDGKISLPLLNDIQASGLTPTKLADEITSSLKKFVTNPQVTVVVTTINSQRIYILGEVTRAGAYPLLPGMTVLQGLSSAGGFTQFANMKKIYVLRQNERLPFNYKDVIAGKRPEENIILKAGDTIIVP